ncbi:uncharacterized protein TNCV_991871 [Trichonephila clavipes]|nr:uncharacterized protein TNCV_991871 [Trichonephila clavipes]
MQFWPINGKGIARKTVHDCIACFRQKPTAIDQLMGNLPSERVTPSAPFLNAEAIQWKFIPPRSTNFGGLWESGVKSFKHHLYRTLVNSKITFEEFETIIIQIEGILNSRPLVPLSDNINEYEVLTPGHFIIGRPISAIPEPAILDISDNRLSRWQYTTKCVQTIWKRWKNDYLNHLQQRNKWQFEKNNVAVGCLVLLKENDLPPCKWAMARILEVIYGTDEEIEEPIVKNKERLICEKHYANTHFRTKEGKYVVSMPLKKEPSCLGNSKDIALKRLGSLWNRLARDDNYLNLYREFLRDYERLGHMKEVTNETEPKIAYYATHHGIYRPEKSTTKLRVVFNCSSLTDNRISLNDIQYNGGVIQEDLYAQMLRFRTYTYAFTADIKMMYRTILINPKQRNLQRIVWCESEHESPKIYELSTVTYGTVSAPYLAQRTLTQLSMDEEANFPIAASVLRNNLYMDDVLCGAATSYTKRDVLSTIAKIFDPVGLMAPVISKAKIFLQRLWRSKLEWNDLLPAEEYREWQQFLVSLENINNIEIPRRILVAFPEVTEIHGFADASERGYGAAVYCKSKKLKSETLVRLITSKSRVAPIKSLTIPRLELCAAVLLAKLVKRVVAALQLETAEVYLWSDSMIILAWLRKEPMDLKTFVQNRVAKIQEFYPNQLWRHVPSDQNPADLVSRGVDPEKLLQQNLWFNGPTFLSGDDYPNRTINCREKLDEYNSELKNCVNEQIENFQSVLNIHVNDF